MRSPRSAPRSVIRRYSSNPHAPRGGNRAMWFSLYFLDVRGSGGSSSPGQLMPQHPDGKTHNRGLSFDPPNLALGHPSELSYFLLGVAGAPQYLYRVSCQHRYHFSLRCLGLQRVCPSLSPRQNGQVFRKRGGQSFRNRQTLRCSECRPFGVYGYFTPLDSMSSSVFRISRSS